MLRVEMLPARQGDALWIEYGDAAHPKRMLVDGGTPGSWQAVRTRIEQLGEGERRFELVVITHIDTDHIGGMLPLLEDDALGIEVGDVWFNGYRHLPGAVDPMGPVHGERLTKLLIKRGLPWNEAFGGNAVVVPDGEPPPRVECDDGLALTVLSPRPVELATLLPVWGPVVKEHGLDPDTPAQPAPAPPGIEVMGGVGVGELAARKFGEDGTVANGSSIALLLEYDGKTVMLCADAFPLVLLDSLDRLLNDAPTGARLKLDAFKLPHHGSRRNLNLELMRRLECGLLLVSTDGTQTHHPHPEAVARAVVTQEHAQLVFNYRTKYTELWDPAAHAVTHRRDQAWTAGFPQPGEGGSTVDL